LAKSPKSRCLTINFGSFLGLARVLISKGHRSAAVQAGEKGRLEMSAKSQFTRTLIAIVAALATSTIAIGAAVGPAQAVASPSQVTFHA
jgi:predicted ATP-binding protein involved in virulence